MEAHVCLYFYFMVYDLSLSFHCSFFFNAIRNILELIPLIPMSFSGALIFFLALFHVLAPQPHLMFSLPPLWTLRTSKSLLEKCQSFSCFQIFATPGTIATQGFSVHGILQQEHWSGLPFPSPGDLPDPGIEPSLLVLQLDSVLSELPGKPSKCLLTCS